MLAAQVAVVAGEYQQGPIELPGGTHAPHQPTDEPIDTGQRFQLAHVFAIEALARGPIEARSPADVARLVGDIALVDARATGRPPAVEPAAVPRGRFGVARGVLGQARVPVRPVGGDPEEERATAWSGAAHEPGRLVGEDVGLVGVGPTRLAAVVNDLPVLVEIEVERALLVRGGEAVPLAPPGRYLAYRLARPVAVEELADECGAIAGVRQPHGEGVRRSRRWYPPRGPPLSRTPWLCAY